MRLSFALGVGIGGVSSWPDDCPTAAAAAGRGESNPGTSGSSESRRTSPDATLEPRPGCCTAFEALGEVTETCVEQARSLSKCEASASGTEGWGGLLSLLPLMPLTHVAVDPCFELRAVMVERRLERVAREASFHAAILLGR